MTTHYDTLVIGTGTAGYTAAYRLAAAGQRVAVADRQAYGGTCALRGCQPKKYLVAAAEALERAEALVDRGIAAAPRLVWADLQRAKRQFTDPVPDETRAGFEAAGIATLDGNAAFVAEDTLQVAENRFTADHFLIATGAVPRALTIPGAELLLTSDRFLELPRLPERILFVGGGYISFEFAHVAARAGAAVTILHRNDRPLAPFDIDMVAALLTATAAAGIRVVLNAADIHIQAEGGGRRVAWIGDAGSESCVVDAAFHGAGRLAAVDGLNPQTGGIAVSTGGVIVKNTLQSVSNPRVYAVGDAADTPYELAPVADREAEVAARNILHADGVTLAGAVVPSVVFTLPPLAAVGLTEAAACAQGAAMDVRQGSAAHWPSSRRIGQQHASYKVLLDPDSGSILGAHLLGHAAGEMINIFALAMQQQITAAQLKAMLWAYPTHVSDIKYML